MKNGTHLVLLLLVLSATGTIAETPGNVFGRHPTANSAAFGRGISPNAKVTVQVVQRNLDIDFSDGKGSDASVISRANVIASRVASGAARAANSRWVHTQIIVRDEYGHIIDTENFGYFSEDENGIDRGGSVRGETKKFDYDFTPRYEATVSYADYYAAKQEAKKRFDTAGKYAKFAFSPQPTGRVRDNPADQMSMVEFEGNCQAFAEYFTDRLNEKDSCKVTRYYSPPGTEGGVVNLDAFKLDDGASGNGSIEGKRGIVNVASAYPLPSAQPVQMPSATVNQAAPAYQTPTIDMSAMLGQVSEQIANVQSQRHYCTSFEFVKDYRGANREVYAKQYRCTECGKGTMINVRDGETIEDKIASNKQHQAFDNQAYSTAQSALQGMGTSVPSGGYSPEIMDKFGRTFVEQGPCSAGLQLEALKNQHPNK